MFIVNYLIIGVVVWAIVTAERTIRGGWEYIKTTYDLIWNIFTDIIVTALVWPFVVGCYALGYAFVLYGKLKGDLA